jgi:serine/threonine protein kinase
VARGAPGNLGPYRLLNVVHTGHGSQIWQAYDDVKQCIVGVKTLRQLDRIDRQQVQFLRQEFLVGRAVHHPLVIEIYSFDWDRGQPYIAMEWFSAPNMKQRLLQGFDKFAPLMPKVVEQAAEALGHFHRAGWIHRDIKPDNFLVADDGQVKLIDFALAKRRRGGLARWFSPRTRLQQGTKSYMSPEQIRGLPLDQRSDLYSFACTLHELLSGKPPFTGANVNDLFMKHLRSQPPSLEVLNPNVVPAFAQLLRRSMAKDPRARPKSLDDFLTEFRIMRVFRSNPVAPS